MTVSLIAAKFYAKLRQRSPERAACTSSKSRRPRMIQSARRSAPSSISPSTSDEQSSVHWLHQLLSGDPKTYQQSSAAFPARAPAEPWRAAARAARSIGAELPKERARESVHSPLHGHRYIWRNMRRHEQLREYAAYTAGLAISKACALRRCPPALKKTYRTREYAAILAVAAQLPEAVLCKDRTILTYYELARWWRRDRTDRRIYQYLSLLQRPIIRTIAVVHVIATVPVSALRPIEPEQTS
jgi:hypothetical protein